MVQNGENIMKNIVFIAFLGALTFNNTVIHAKKIAAGAYAEAMKDVRSLYDKLKKEDVVINDEITAEVKRLEGVLGKDFQDPDFLDMQEFYEEKSATKGITPGVVGEVEGVSRVTHTQEPQKTDPIVTKKTFKEVYDSITPKKDLTMKFLGGLESEKDSFNLIINKIRETITNLINPKIHNQNSIKENEYLVRLLHKLSKTPFLTNVEAQNDLTELANYIENIIISDQPSDDVKSLDYLKELSKGAQELIINIEEWYSRKILTKDDPEENDPKEEWYSTIVLSLDSFKEVKHNELMKQLELIKFSLEFYDWEEEINTPRDRKFFTQDVDFFVRIVKAMLDKMTEGDTKQQIQNEYSKLIKILDEPKSINNIRQEIKKYTDKIYKSIKAHPDYNPDEPFIVVE
jgi:hypothetical protein